MTVNEIKEKYCADAVKRDTVTGLRIASTSLEERIKKNWNKDLKKFEQKKANLAN